MSSDKNVMAPEMGTRFTVFWTSRRCGPAGRLPLFLIKAGDGETNPGPTTTPSKVCICNICHRQIHVMKQILIRCNMIEHWVHLRCAGICRAQYRNTWTCHIHTESRLTAHTDIIPPTLKTMDQDNPTPPTTPHQNSPNTYYVTLSLFLQYGKAQTQSSQPLTPHLLPAPSQAHTHFTHSTNTYNNNNIYLKSNIHCI